MNYCNNNNNDTNNNDNKQLVIIIIIIIITIVTIIIITTIIITIIIMIRIIIIIKNFKINSYYKLFQIEFEMLPVDDIFISFYILRFSYKSSKVWKFLLFLRPQ